MSNQGQTIVKDSSQAPIQRVLSVRERESLGQALGAHQDVLDTTDTDGRLAVYGASPVKIPGLRVNKPKMSDQAAAIKKTLDQGTPQPLSPAEKDAMFKKGEELRARFQHVLETRGELRVKRRDDSRWDSSMEKARLRPQFEKDIQEWKFIQRRLDPENPDADSLHKLRKD